MQEPAEQTVVAGISPTAQIYLGFTATPLALPAPWHLYQVGGRPPISGGGLLLCGYVMTSQASIPTTGKKVSQAVSWGPSPGPVSQGVNLAPI